MPNRICLFTLFVVAACAQLLPASEEEHLPWAEVKITGADRPDTGKVVFTAKLAGEKYKEVRIEAFGKQYDLTKEQLDKLTGFPITSLRLTHEAGYPQLGGHMVHARLKKTSAASGQIIHHGVTLSVSKGKGLNVSSPIQLLKGAN